MSKFTRQEIKNSKRAALKEILRFLRASDIESPFKGRDGGYYSREKFIVSWIDNWKSIPSEFSLDLCDSFYQSYSGFVCTLSHRSIVHEKQIGGYRSIHRGLIEAAVKIIGKDKKGQLSFFRKYVVPYNEALNKRKEGKANELQ
ncbi:hypothetical protein EHO57_13715 [Leptospira langatensis]|uniref:Uncharacterized protein n=1 Tax=Leptospira langatensis TaxID=2484983 RepID=A0A5R2ASW4_9LEPT|nr:hypothetical protein [Leptospira langatensis]TGJ99816.1 hypothetical protein EHO57_13715 [Leptospira langatensis]